MPCTISSVVVSLCAPQLGPGNTDENDAQDEAAASTDSATCHWFGHGLSTVVRGKASRRPHPRRKPAIVVGAELDVRRAAVHMFRLVAAHCGKNSKLWAFANAELSRCLPHCPDGPEALCGAIPKGRLLALAAVAVLQQFGRKH